MTIYDILKDSAFKTEQYKMDKGSRNSQLRFLPNRRKYLGEI